MKYHGIIFDLDGTLLDTLDDMADSINQVLTDLSFPYRTKAEVSSFIGHGVKYLLACSLPEGSDEDLVEQSLRRYQDVYKQNMFNQTHPFEGIPQLLQRLAELHLKMGVLSNKPDGDVKALCRLHFPGLFRPARGDRPGVARKPSADCVLPILQEMGTSAQQTLYVGDSEVDVQTAHNAGMACAAVVWGLRSEETLKRAGAQHIIYSPDEILQLFEETV